MWPCFPIFAFASSLLRSHLPAQHGSAVMKQKQQQSLSKNGNKWKKFDKIKKVFLKIFKNENVRKQQKQFVEKTDNA